MAEQMNSQSGDLRIEVITNAEDFKAAFQVAANAFGHQTADGIWTAMNPGWDTEEGVRKGAQRLADQWSSTKDSGFRHFLKATVPTEGDQRDTAGFAIWAQLSFVPAHGEVPGSMNFASLYPDNESEQRYLSQLMSSLLQRRLQTIKEKGEPDSLQKSVLVLDLCAVDPRFQGQGIGKKLAQWGVDEAERLGGIECTTEASSMGRKVYRNVGFREIQEIQYEVDEEFKGRDMPSNVFMRTGSGGILKRN